MGPHSFKSTGYVDFNRFSFKKCVRVNPDEMVIEEIVETTHQKLYKLKIRCIMYLLNMAFVSVQDPSGKS